MALSNAERQRRHYQRQKEKKRAGLKQTEALEFKEVAQTPFFEYFQEVTCGFSDFTLCFDLAGIEPPNIKDDTDPKSLYGEIERDFAEEPENSPYVKGGGSLARGELMVGCLIDAAWQMASMLNSYKRNEINNRIAELEASDLSDADERKKALNDMVQLKSMLDQLEKEVRWSFPQWKVS